MLGVDSKTVQSVRHALERTSELPKFDKLIGADGKARPVKQTRPAAIMAANTVDLRRILEKIERGASSEDIQGFLSEQGFEAAMTIRDDHYDPFAHCDDDGKRAWLIFLLHLTKQLGWNPEGAWAYMEWRLQKQFKTPAEWLGEEGAKFRRHCGLSEIPAKTIKRTLNIAAPSIMSATIWMRWTKANAL